MTLEEAMDVIDLAWHSPPGAIDWNTVEEASMVIVAETGKPYLPGVDAKDPRPMESRGTPDGYDAAVRDADDDELDRGVILEPSDLDLLADDGAEDRYLQRCRSGQELGAEWSRRARGQL